MITTIFDTETTGFAIQKLADADPKQAKIVQLAAVMVDEETWKEEMILSTIIYPYNYTEINEGAQKVHGISFEKAQKLGTELGGVMAVFHDMIYSSDRAVCHNMAFDRKLARNALALAEYDPTVFNDTDQYCTMKSSTNLLKLPFPSGKKGYKFPKLEELYEYFCKEEMVGAHDALCDVRATIAVYRKLKEMGLAGE